MKKPDDYDDYDVYFYPDGSDRDVPHEMPLVDAIPWCRRQMEIMLSLMSDEEREKFLARRRLLYKRWASEIPPNAVFPKFNH